MQPEKSPALLKYEKDRDEAHQIWLQRTAEEHARDVLGHEPTPTEVEMVTSMGL